MEGEMNDDPNSIGIEETVGELIERHGLFREGDRVLVAVSGGADSTALLTIMHHLSHRFGIQLAVGHFDHRLRDTSHMDRRHVEVAAANLGLLFHYGEGDVMTRADLHGETVEEAARKLRYQYLFELADEIRADRIATGHTRDDQVETVLMRILRGTGTRGLSGIPAERGRLVRPLLALTHLQLVNYCRQQHIPFVEDPLNRDKRFTRNWLRFELLPSIRKYYPNVGDNLLRLSRNAADAVSRTRRTTAPLLSRNLRFEHDPGVWTLDLSGIVDLDPDAKYILFGDLLTDHLDHDPDYTRVHFEKLSRLSGRLTDSGDSLSIPGFTVRREFETLVFTPSRGENDSPAPTVESLSVPGEAMVGGVRLVTTVHRVGDEIFDAGEFRTDEPQLFESGGNPTGGVAYFALEGLEPPLIVRSPRAGDRMRPFGMKGSKKLSDIFIDKKIPLRRRDKALVVCDQKQILWLVGVGTTESARITAETGEVLRITVNPE
jgi:tRNA(Ile)-lysidine synthase